MLQSLSIKLMDGLKKGYERLAELMVNEVTSVVIVVINIFAQQYVTLLFQIQPIR